MTQEITKEVSEYKDQVSLVQSKANKLVIASDEDMANGSDILSELRLVEKFITERKKAITKPLMDGLASARDLFKPLEKNYADATKIVKDKMLKFALSEEDRIEKEKGKVEARVEKGTMKVETAVDKMDSIGEVKKSFAGEKSKISIREVTKIRITDESLIPREYLTPDVNKITEAVLKKGLEISGVKIYVEKSLVGRTR